MWLIRYQNIRSGDYVKITRLCKKAGFCPKKFSATILVKGIITHILLKKSWRKIAAQFGLPYLPIYQFYQKIKDKPELIEMLEYFCERSVIIYMGEGGNITRELLESNSLLSQSLEQIKREL